MTTPACFGMSALFDDTRPEAHVDARAICETCPLFNTPDAPCLNLPEWPTGTWHGRLYSNAGNLRIVGHPKIRKTWDEVRVHSATGLIACPTCGAKVSESCRTKTGRNTDAHKARLAPRLCECGSDLGPHRKFCDDCRDARYATSQVEHMARQREKKRAERMAS